MRKKIFFILLLVALLSLPSFAFADASTDELSGGEGVGWQGIITSGDDTGLYGVVGRSLNKYNMACWAMGKNPLTIADDVRSKLSDPSYGGRFYEYANTFESIPSWDYVPEWQPTYTNLTYVLYGFDFQWESAVPMSLYEGAKEDFRRVLAGEDLSGGGSVDPSGYSGVVVNAMASTQTNNVISYDAPNAFFADGVITTTGGVSPFSAYTRSNYYVSTLQLYLATPVVVRANDYISQGYDVIFGLSLGGVDESLIIYGHGLSISFDGAYKFYGSDIRFVVPSSCNDVYHSSDGFFHVSYDVPAGGQTGSFASGSNVSYFSSVISSPISVPVIPPGGDWPTVEPTPTPTAPEIPTPTAPTDTPDPNPTEPTVVWPTAPIVVNPPDVTVEVTPSGLDYTELLTRINDNLNELNSYVQAINGSLNSLRSDIIGGFDDVVTSLRNIYQYLQHLNDILELHCKHLRDALDDGIYNLELYIKSLFEWLPQQLDFDAKFDYDDTAVTSLLRRILGKIPGGSGDAPTTYMPNPQADEPGFFDWLTDLWHRFLIDLVSVLPDELGGLVDAFSQLTHYFPFSIPWDLAALLALFEHEPVTPVFDVPWGFGGDEGEVEMVRVDLSAWDGVMEMIRPVFVVGFCWQLALITKELLGNFDINKGGV